MYIGVVYKSVGRRNIHTLNLSNYIDKRMYKNVPIEIDVIGHIPLVSQGNDKGRKLLHNNHLPKTLYKRVLGHVFIVVNIS